MFCFRCLNIIPRPSTAWRQISQLWAIMQKKCRKSKHVDGNGKKDTKGRQVGSNPLVQCKCLESYTVSDRYVYRFWSWPGVCQMIKVATQTSYIKHNWLLNNHKVAHSTNVSFAKNFIHLTNNAIPFSKRQNLATHIFCLNYLERRMEIGKQIEHMILLWKKWSSTNVAITRNRQYHTLDSKFIRIADFVACLARFNCISLTERDEQSVTPIINISLIQKKINACPFKERRVIGQHQVVRNTTWYQDWLVLAEGFATVISSLTNIHGFWYKVGNLNSKKNRKTRQLNREIFSTCSL